MKHYELVPKKRWGVHRTPKAIEQAMNYYANKGYVYVGEGEESVKMELETDPENSDV